MNDNNRGNSESSRRVCNRLKLSRTLLLELNTGDYLQGQTVDISPRGVLVKSDTAPEDALVGMTGTLFIISDNGQFSVGYPCKVVRQEVLYIALEIHKNSAAAFGNYMTQELLGR